MLLSTFEPGYNDIGLCDTPHITSHILCYQFLTVNHNIILLGYNDIGLCDTPHITSHILCYQFLTVNHNIILLGYNDIGLCYTPHDKAWQSTSSAVIHHSTSQR